MPREALGSVEAELSEESMTMMTCTLPQELSITRRCFLNGSDEHRPVHGLVLILGFTEKKTSGLLEIRSAYDDQKRMGRISLRGHRDSC
jgi:hypothetical protein